MGKLVGAVALSCIVAVLGVAVLASAVVGGATSSSGSAPGATASGGVQPRGPSLPDGWAA